MEKLEKMEDTFAAFKKEALLRKKEILTGEFGAKEFMDWLYPRKAQRAARKAISQSHHISAKHCGEKNPAENNHHDFSCPEVIDRSVLHG